MSDGRDGYRIGVGAGFAGDRYEPADDLARRGGLDALVFECLAERTIALAQRARRAGTSEGYDPRILRRLRTTLPHLLADGACVVTNAGAADPVAAARAIKSLCAELGTADVPVAAVSGDDVLARLDLADCQVMGTERTLADDEGRIVSANAYTGAAGIVDALGRGARIVVTGRTSDAALFLAPLAVHFGWELTADLDPVAEGLLTGHLLECGGQLTGGYFADGYRKQISGLARLGFPYADVSANGHASYGKLPGTGGRLDTSTVVEQLLYEIDDPTRYVTPDGVLDLSGVRITEDAPDRVSVSGGRIIELPQLLKASVGIDDGYLATAEIMYAGAGCRQRADLAASIVRERWADVHGRSPDELVCELVGVNAARPWWQPADGYEPAEVRLRASIRTFDRGTATDLLDEVEALYTNGPAGGGGVTRAVRETIGIVSTLVPREVVETDVRIL